MRSMDGNDGVGMGVSDAGPCKALGSMEGDDGVRMGMSDAGPCKAMLYCNVKSPGFHTLPYITDRRLEIGRTGYNTVRTSVWPHNQEGSNFKF